MTTLDALSESWATLDPARWEVVAPASTKATDVTVSAGHLMLRPERAHVRATSVDYFDLTGSALTAELVSPPNINPNGKSTHTLLQLVDQGDLFGRPESDATLWWVKALGWSWDASNQLKAYRRDPYVNGTGQDVVLATLPYDSTAHRWLQIIERGGVVTWRTSPDAQTWTTRATWAATIALDKLRVDLIAGYVVDVGEEFPPGPGFATWGAVNPPPVVADDPGTIITGDGVPNLAVDVIPEVTAGTFQVDVDDVDGVTLLAWDDLVEGAWANIVCDVTGVSITRGSSRAQGVLTRAEAGHCTVSLSDTLRRFDPLANADAIHSNTPVRVRAWGYAPVVTPVEDRRNRVGNPQPVKALTGWTANFGTGGAGTVAALPADGPFGGAFARATWSTASTAAGTGQLRADGRQGSGVNIRVTPGEKVSAAIYARPSITQRLACVLAWFDGAGGTAGIVPLTVAGPAQVVNAGQWVRLTIEGVTVPANATQVMVVAQAVAGSGAAVWPVGATLDATMAQLEATATLGDYFDGDTAGGDANLTVPGRVSYGWLSPQAFPQGPAIRYVTAATGAERWDAVLFTGTITDLPVTYPRDDAPQVTITATDRIADLVAWAAAGRLDPGTGAGDNLLARVQRTVAETGAGPDAISYDVDRVGYAVTHPPVPLARPWDELSSAQDAELGRVWVTCTDQLVVRSRGSELSGPVRGTFSDVHGDADPGVPHCCILDGGLVATLGTEQLTNRAIGSRRIPNDGTTPTPVPLVVQTDDQTSAVRWGSHVTERRSLEVQTDAQTQAWADYLVAHQAVPELRVDSIAAAPSPGDLDSALQAWPAVCATDLGDRWAVRYRPALGPMVDRTVGILGIDHSISPDGGWAVVFTTTDAPDVTTGNPTGYFLLDVSELDTGDVLSPLVVTNYPLGSYMGLLATGN